MQFLGRRDEIERLTRAFRDGGGFAAVWGRRRVGKSRLLLEFVRRHGGLYAVADESAPPIQRRYLAEAVASRFPGFADVIYPDWRALLERLSLEADRAGYRGPVVIDEIPYLLASEPALAGVLQNWLDRPGRNLGLIVSGSSQRTMQDAVLNASAPLYGRTSEALALRPLRPGYLADAFPCDRHRSLVEMYAAWGGMPRYWELAAPYGSDLDAAVNALALDPAGPLHLEPDRLLRDEMPSAMALRPLLDAIGAGAHRAGEIAARVGRPASSLSKALSWLVELGLVRREIPFGSHPRSGKRSLYRISDPFLRLWFRVVAPHRAALAEAPPETRLEYWKRHRAGLVAYAWEELCRMAVPTLHRCDVPLARCGPFEPAQRYWRGSAPVRDVVARSADGRRILVGETTWSSRAPPRAGAPSRWDVSGLPGAAGREAVHAWFVPEAGCGADRAAGAHVVTADTVLAALR